MAMLPVSIHIMAIFYLTTDGRVPWMQTWTERMNEWVNSEDEDSKLKDAIQTHGRKKSDTSAALVTDRTKVTSSAFYC
jgi:hypothetical protein